MSSDASATAVVESSIPERVIALRTRAKSQAPLVMLTAYDFVSARLVDQAGVDLILVGDSAATTVLGYDFTHQIQRDELLMLTRAARRGVKSALLVGDLPFGTYESSDDEAVSTAREFVRAGCDLVKLEGAGLRLARVNAIIAAGIPVIGHVGLLPQAARTQSDLRARGRTADGAAVVLRDALALEEAGCSALVIEAVPAVVATTIARRVSIPVIGIGAGNGVDGQVLVMHDMVGLSDGHIPKFVRQYANAGDVILNAVRRYASDVRQRAFPSVAEEYRMPDAERELFEALVATSGATL